MAQVSLLALTCLQERRQARNILMLLAVPLQVCRCSPTMPSLPARRARHKGAKASARSWLYLLGATLPSSAPLPHQGKGRFTHYALRLIPHVRDLWVRDKTGDAEWECHFGADGGDPSPSRSGCVRHLGKGHGAKVMGSRAGRRREGGLCGKFPLCPLLSALCLPWAPPPCHP